MAAKDDWEEVAPADDWEEVDAKPSGSFASAAGGLAQYAEDQVPFIEPLRKVGYANVALQDKLFADDDQTFEQYYERERKRAEADRQRIRDQAPEWTKPVGSIAGATTNFAVGMPQVAGAGLVGGLSRIAGTAGMAGLERGLSNPNRLFDSEEAQQGAGIAGGIQAGVETALPVIGKVASIPFVQRNIDRFATGMKSAEDWLRNQAGQRAVKAGFGQNVKAFREYAENGGIDRIAEKGNQLLQDDWYGPKVVAFGRNVEETGNRARAKQAVLRNEFERLGAQIDEVAPNSVSGKDVAQHIRNWGNENLTRLSHDQAKMQRLEELAAEYEALGDFSFKEAQAFKNSFKPPNFNQPSTSFVQESDIQPMLKKSFGEAMNTAAERASKIPGAEETAADYARVKEAYSAVRPIARESERRQIQDLSNRYVSPSDYAMAATQVVADPSGNAAKGALAAFINKQARTRGSAAAASTANRMANTLGYRPDLSAIDQAVRSGRAAFTGAQTDLFMGERQADREADWYSRQLQQTNQP